VAATPGPTVVAPAAAIPDASNALAAAPALSLEQRRQAELVANAERIDEANRALLAKNQELQLQNDNLNVQNNMLKHDRSSDGMWKGAGIIAVGFALGLFFASRQRKSKW
jgi:hypothetical protein